MASDLVDGDYLGSYRKFIVNFLDKVNPDDQLPIKTSGHDVAEGEMDGEIVHMTLQYLNQQLCPPSLQCYIVKLVIEEIKATCKKQPESCGFRREDQTYAPLKLMQAVVSKVNEICQRYLENSRLALLPPPPSTPMPLANAFAIKNNRRKMEDRHVILHDLNTIFNIKDDSIASYYAVFDGHAGYQAAVFCAAHLHQYLAESPYYPTDPEGALRDAFRTTDHIFVQKSTRQTLSSGTTAVCALILNRKLYVAWAGDSQAALAKRGIVTQLVNPHKPDRNDERERVEQMGGTVMLLGIWRVNGNLAVSRAIGDAQYKPYVTGDPEIRCITLDGEEDFLIIGCDGLWDCVTENEAAALVYGDLCRDPYNHESASQHLVEYAKSQGSIDNITVIVVFLSSPSRIASRSSHYGNPLLADVQLDNMEPDNRFLSNANGQFDVNSPFAKQTVTNNGLQALMNDEDTFSTYSNKSSNGKHQENGVNESGAVDYDAEEEDEDLGPETDVDALDDAFESVPTLANVSRQLFSEKQASCEIYQSVEQKINDETPASPQDKTNQQSLIPEADNVGDSEDSEDEWNYYKIDPNKEKESPGAGPGFSPEPTVNKELQGDIVEAVAASESVKEREPLENDDNDDVSDSSSEPSNEIEVRSNDLIDKEISTVTNPEQFPFETNEEKVDTVETEKTELQKEAEDSNLEASQDDCKTSEEDMDFQLNPNAAEFVPVSPTLIIPTRMELDAPIAGSPLKQAPVMDDIMIPSRREFEDEVRNRPCEIEEKSSCSNGQLVEKIENCASPTLPNAINILNLDESEVSSTKAEFGDESSFLTTSELHRTDASNLDGSFLGSCSGFNDSVEAAMTRSFGPGDFMALGNPVDLNAVHDLTDADNMADEYEAPEIADTTENINLETIQATESNSESPESLNKIETNDHLFSNNQTPNIMDSSSPSSLVRGMHFGSDFTNEITERIESPVSSVLEAEKVAREDEILSQFVETASSNPQFVDETSVTSKLLEMDVEDRGSQDCAFEKCNEESPAEIGDPRREDEAVDLISSPVVANNFNPFFVHESLPVETLQSEEIDKLAKSLGDLCTDDHSRITETPDESVQLKLLDLDVNNVQLDQKDIECKAVEDNQVAEAPEIPVDLISPLEQPEPRLTNPFESAFDSPILSSDQQEAGLHPQVQDANIEPQVTNTIEIPSEIVAGLKLSESLQEFTGLEQQLNPEVIETLPNGFQPENLMDRHDEGSKIDTLVVTPVANEDSADDKIVEGEKKVEAPVEDKALNIEKKEVIAAVAAAVATAGTVAATKSKPVVSSVGKVGTKPAAKTLANKSTPTSPTKPAVTARTSSLVAAKKPTTTAARPTKLDTGKTAPVATKLAGKSSTTETSKTAGRSSAVTAQRANPAVSTLTKTSVAEKKPAATNGDAAKLPVASSKVSSTTLRAAPNKPPVKVSTTRAAPATTTSTTAKTARASSATTTSTLAKTQTKSTTGTLSATAPRVKSAPTTGATNLAAKSRLTSATKSPITEKQIKETANKQISSCRTSTTNTASKTTRTSATSSSTSTSTRRVPSKTSGAAAAAAAASVPQAVPPPIRKPGSVPRPPGKNGAAAPQPATNGKSVATKTNAISKPELVVQNGTVNPEQDTKIVISTNNEDVPKKDLSPVEPLNDNQLIAIAD